MSLDVHYRISAQAERLAPETDVETLVAVDVAEESRLDDPWHVVLFNDEIHTFDEVIIQIVKATGCSMSDAERFAWQVHTEGKSRVFGGDFEPCLKVQGVLKEIGLVTEVQG